MAPLRLACRNRRPKSTAVVTSMYRRRLLSPASCLSNVGEVVAGCNAVGGEAGPRRVRGTSTQCAVSLLYLLEPPIVAGERGWEEQLGLSCGPTHCAQQGARVDIA